MSHLSAPSPTCGRNAEPLAQLLGAAEIDYLLCPRHRLCVHVAEKARADAQRVCSHAQKRAYKYKWWCGHENMVVVHAREAPHLVSPYTLQ